MCVLGRLNGCLAAFTEVDDRVELWEVRRCKRNKLYREYEEAVKLAKMILRRYDNSIDRASAEEHALPAFWIDMSLLYEHYVLGALRKAYGPKILYQANVTTGKPDFLYVDEARPLILDTKYKPRYRNKRVSPFCICLTVYAWMNVTGLRGTLRGSLRGRMRGG